MMLLDLDSALGGLEDVVPLELVTPLINPGADKYSVGPERVRAPSLRGALRWWFRALFGAVLDVNHLASLESFLFGSAEEKGLVSTSVRPAGEKGRWKSRVRTFNGALAGRPSTKYFYYSLQQTGYERAANVERQLVVPPAEFDLVLGWSPATLRAKLEAMSDAKFEKRLGFLGKREGLDVVKFKKFTWASLFFLLFAGGVGARTRRAAGRLAVRSGPSERDAKLASKLPRLLRPSPDKSLTEFLRNFVGNLVKHVGTWVPKGHPQVGLPGHSVVAKGRFKMFVHAKGFKGWMEAVDRLYLFYHGREVERGNFDGFRFQFKERQFKKNFFSCASQGDDELRPFLGLPIVFSKTEAVSAYAGEDEARRASPVWLGVVKWNGRFHPTVSAFKSRFLDVGMAVAGRGGRIGQGSKPLHDPDAYDDLFNEVWDALGPREYLPADEWERVF
ncbi:MAG: hypothetical protein Kow0069_37680 [Promethearchaeota archaeon]